MPEDNLLPRVLSLVSRVFEIPENKLTPETRFVDDLGCDSERLMELVQSLEETFGVEIPTHAGAEMGSPEEVTRWLRSAGVK